MFDIGFTELLLCLVVALVVIGPEQLPGTVRTVALWFGRLKRSLAETRSEIERQIGADDIRRQLHNEEIMRNIEETRLQIEASIREHGFDLAQSVSNEPAALEHQPSAADYGPPDELPDHSHGGTPNNQQKPTTAASATTTGSQTVSPQPASTTPAVSAQVPQQNNQQNQTPAPLATTTVPQSNSGAGQ